ncbi:MAG: hypothetical protein KBF70_07535, partial [Moraxellaceae bacterium]|nr:hypothetical protein [Moraxellaceae bacterium]
MFLFHYQFLRPSLNGNIRRQSIAATMYMVRNTENPARLTVAKLTQFNLLFPLVFLPRLKAPDEISRHT